MCNIKLNQGEISIMKKTNSVPKNKIRNILKQNGITMERTTTLNGKRGWQLSNGERYRNWTELHHMVYEKYIKKQERAEA